MEGNGISMARSGGAAGAAPGGLAEDADPGHAGSGLARYRGSYVDLVLGAESERGTVSLVAGSHTRSFPYADTDPWDNCLLLVGDEGYTFTGRTQGAALRLELDLEQASPRGTIHFDGEMRRARDGRPARIQLEIAVALSPFPTRLLGECYNVLELPGLPGLRWTPYALAGELGSVRIDGAALALRQIRGSCERGVLTSLETPALAIEYDYVAVGCPGEDGYGLISFTSHPLRGRGLVGRALDWFLARSASALLTIERGALTDGNPRGVYIPPQDDPAVALFEDEVDLGPAVLKRQMIETRDRSGRRLHGLREIFIAKPPPAPRRTFRFNRAQVNALLLALVVLDLVLATVALGFPERWNRVFYDLPYDDPAGMLPRTGAVWAAFTLLQAIALVRWRAQPYWLPLVAGVRFTELFSDWTALALAQQTTTFGTIGLLIAPPANLIFGLLLLSTYRRARTGPVPGGSVFSRPWSRGPR